jgi:hypothetical protein
MSAAAGAPPSAKSKTSSQEPRWVVLIKDHIKKNFNPTQSVFAHVVESDEHLEIMRLLQILQFEVNKNFKPKFMWETATKPDLQAVLEWIVVSDNMIKRSDASFLMAITAIQICTDKIDGNL